MSYALKNKLLVVTSKTVFTSIIQQACEINRFDALFKSVQ